MTKSLLEFIKQVILEELAPEAEKEDVFGQWLDPDKRNLGVKEPNTEEETSAIKALRAFMSYNNDPSKLSADGGKYANMFLDLMKRHKYSPVLDPDASQVYRGLGFNDVEKWIGFFAKYPVASFSAYDKDGNEIDTEGKPFQEVLESKYYSEITGTISSFTLYPTEGTLVQSWSEDLNTAVGFANSSNRGGLVMKTNIEGNNFFGTPGEIAKLAGGSVDEEETISVGSVNVSLGMFVISRRFLARDDFWKKVKQFDG